MKFKNIFYLLAVFQLICSFCYAKESPFNVDVFFGWDGCYRPMEWTPVEIGISSELTEPFEGSITLSAKQDDLNVMNVSHSFVLTPDIPLHIPLVTKFAYAADNGAVNLSNRRGRTQWRQNYDLWDYSENKRLLNPVEEKDLLIGLIGDRKYGLFRLSEQTICTSNAGMGNVFLKDKLPNMVPWDWTGFACLDLLILYDVNWTLLNSHQLNAISQWISNGGKLLLVLGGRPIDESNPIAAMLPFNIGEPKKIKFSEKTLEKLALKTEQTEEIVSHFLFPRQNAGGCQTVKDENGNCIFATAFSGFGRVGIIGFDPSLLSDRQKDQSAHFWIKHIKSVIDSTVDEQKDVVDENRRRNARQSILATRRSIALADIDNVDTSRNYRYDIGLAQAGSNAIMEHLYNIAQMRPLSIWWVILLLLLLAVLLGPVDYIVLKRKGRLPLTWLTCTFWIIVFTVGAYYGVQALRSGEMQLRMVSVLDAVEGSDIAWSTVHSGIFAPKSDDYQLDGLSKYQWWSGVTPSQSSYYGFNRTSAGRNIYCHQYDGSNLPFSLPINIWTMQCLLSESPVERLPISASISKEGNKVVLKITNYADVPITSGNVIFENMQSMSFGSVPASASKEFVNNLNERIDWFSRFDRFNSRNTFNNFSSKYSNEKAYYAQGSVRRTFAISEYLSSGAAVICANYKNAPVSISVKDNQCEYNHIQLVRLVVFPEMKEEI